MSNRVDARDEWYDLVEVKEQPMLFTCLRVDRTTVPKGYFLYEVREDDDGNGEPCQIAKGILVNHLGTLISNKPISLLQTDIWILTRRMIGTIQEIPCGWMNI